MPEMEGIELILSLRRSHPNLPVIALSGGGHNTPEEYLKIGRSAGAAQTLAKPFKIEELLAAVAKLLPTDRRFGVFGRHQLIELHQPDREIAQAQLDVSAQGVGAVVGRGLFEDASQSLKLGTPVL